MNDKRPTVDQSIALFHLAAQLCGTKWNRETFEGDGIEADLESLAETADRIWAYVAAISS